MKDLVEHVVLTLVDDPESAEVTESEQGGRTVYEVTVASGDAGKIIGRGGRIVNALRALVKAAHTKSGERTHVEINA
ncbi:MAG: KH domain-containing protein [Armatimonadia bacterium]|jgi:hypothetical protein|nr:KH domain-containing protein [Armatimonadia bacterium]